MAYELPNMTTELPPSATLTRGVEWWLGREIQISSVEGNPDKIYDARDLINKDLRREYPEGSQDFFTDFNNVSAHTAWRHTEETLRLTQEFEQDPSNAEVHAALMHNLLMHTAGWWRTECYLEGEDQAGYEAMRSGYPAGASIDFHVANRLGRLFGREPRYEDFEPGSMLAVRAAALTAETRQNARFGLNLVRDLHQDFDALPTDPEAIERVAHGFRQAQGLLIGSVVSHAVFAAQMTPGSPEDRGGLPAVQIFEPMSISQGPELITPFAARAA